MEPCRRSIVANRQWVFGQQSTVQVNLISWEASQPKKYMRSTLCSELIIFLWIPKPFVWLENARKKIFRWKFSSVESSQDNSTFWQDMRQTWQLCWEKFSTRMSRVWSSRPRRPAHQCFSLTQALTSLLTSRKTPSSYVLWIQLCSPPQGGLAWSEEWSIPFGMKFWQTVPSYSLIVTSLCNRREKQTDRPW